ncbi:YHYH domain-containing protein [Cupriavidus sp. AU9028]|nr:YHYH domain-containing protein [Cupriavidus sp. AU9028]
MMAMVVSVVAQTASAHGGGLNAEGCHTNRKTGEYHCHRAGRNQDVRGLEDRATRPTTASGAFRTPTPTTSGPTCYTGPRGGTYTITASGRKNYGGC